MSINHELRLATDATDAMLTKMEGLVIALDLVAYEELPTENTESRFATLEIISTVRDQFRDLEKLRQAEWEAWKGDNSLGFVVKSALGELNPAHFSPEKGIPSSKKRPF